MWDGAHGIERSQKYGQRAQLFGCEAPAVLASVLGKGRRRGETGHTV